MSHYIQSFKQWKVTKEENAQEPDSIRYAVASAQLAKRGHVQSSTGLVNDVTSSLHRKPRPSSKTEKHEDEGVSALEEAAVSPH